MAVPLDHQIGAAKVDNQFAAAVMPFSMPAHDSALGPAGRLALLQYGAARGERFAGIDSAMEFQIVHSQEQAASLAQVFDRESEHGQENQHRVQHDTAR